MRSLWWGGVGGWVGWGRLGVIIESNLNRVRLSCCWVGVGLGCDNISPVSTCTSDVLFNPLPRQLAIHMLI